MSFGWSVRHPERLPAQRRRYLTRYVNEDERARGAPALRHSSGNGLAGAESHSQRKRCILTDSSGDGQHHVWPRRNFQKRQREKESHKRFDGRHRG